MKRIFAVIAAAALLPGLTACGDTPYTKTTMALDTVVQVTVYDAAHETFTDEVFAHISAREALWSRTVETSDIARLNAGNGQPVTVSAETAALLQTACAFTAAVGGFDITTASLTDLWTAGAENQTLPTAKALAEALAVVGAERVQVDGTTVTLQGGATVDLGGVAKGQIADEAAALLRENGCERALVDLGGNIVAIGSHRDGSPFHIGIAHPIRGGALAATVAVKDTAVVTSGSYERGYQIGSAWYSHILDPETGCPVENDLASVTILAPTACEADMLSTACFVMGYDAARMFVDSLDGVEAVFVLTDGTVLATDGVELV